RVTRREHLPPSEIVGALLNSIFLDALDADMERLTRINRTLAQVPSEKRELRPIPVLAIRPSQDLGRLAGNQYKNFPSFFRFYLKGIGANTERGGDLLSYIAFEPGYIGRLIELGYEDTMRMRAVVEAFFGE